MRTGPISLNGNKSLSTGTNGSGKDGLRRSRRRYRLAAALSLGTRPAAGAFVYLFGKRPLGQPSSCTNFASCS